MDNNVLEFILRVKDDASKTLEGVGKTVADVEKKGINFKKVFAIAGAAVGAMAGIAVVAMKDWADKAAEAEAETMRFQKTIENAASRWKLDVGDITKQTENLSNAYVKLGFDDETTANSFANLTNAIGDTKLAQQALALSADLARAKGIGLEDASKAVQLAMQGSAKMLKLYNIELEDGATKSEILGKLSQAVGGQAESAAKSLKVQQEALGVTIDNVKEKLGERLLPVLKTLASTIEDFINSEGFKKFTEKLGETMDKVFSEDNMKKVGDLANQLSILSVPIGNVAKAIGDLGTAMSTNGDSMTVFKVVLGALSIAVIGIGQSLDIILLGITNFSLQVQGAILSVQQFIAVMSGNQEEYNKMEGKWAALEQKSIQANDNFLLRANSNVEAMKTVLGSHQETSTKIEGAYSKMSSNTGLKLGEMSSKANITQVEINKSFSEVEKKMSSFNVNAEEQKKKSVNIFTLMAADISNALKTIKFPHIKIGSQEKEVFGRKIQAPTIDVDWYENGGWVNNTGLAVVHAGEYVLSKNMLAGRQSVDPSVTNNNQPITIMANISNELDLNSLGYQLAWITRNSR